jgi:hypothetical protein
MKLTALGVKTVVDEAIRHRLRETGDVAYANSEPLESGLPNYKEVFSLDDVRIIGKRIAETVEGVVNGNGS